MTEEQPDGKRKKRRMTSKDRRDIENDEILKLRDLLPLPQHTRDSMDKASVLRQTIAYLRAHLYTGSAPRPPSCSALAARGQQMCEGESNSMLDALTAFVLIVEKGGRILFVSDQVEQYLGYRPVDMVGESLGRFVHPDDKDKVCRLFYLGRRLPQEERLFTVKMKYQVVRQAKDRNRFRYGYLPMEWSGRMKDGVSSCPSGTPPALVAVVRPSAAVLLIELRLWGYMFISRHDVTRRCTFVDTRCANLVGYGADELLGATFADYYHPEDKPRKQVCHAMLVKYGTASSTCFRFRGKNGRYMWMRCRGSVLYDNKGQEAAYISMNYIISEREAISYIWEEYYTLPADDARPQIPEVAVEKRLLAKDVIATHANPRLPSKAQLGAAVTSHAPDGRENQAGKSQPTSTPNTANRPSTHRGTPMLPPEDLLDFLVGSKSSLNIGPAALHPNTSPDHPGASPGYASSDGSLHGYSSDSNPPHVPSSPDHVTPVLVQSNTGLGISPPHLVDEDARGSPQSLGRSSVSPGTSSVCDANPLVPNSNIDHSNNLYVDSMLCSNSETRTDSDMSNGSIPELQTNGVDAQIPNASRDINFFCGGNNPFPNMSSQSPVFASPQPTWGLNMPHYTPVQYGQQICPGTRSADDNYDVFNDQELTDLESLCDSLVTGKDAYTGGMHFSPPSFCDGPARMPSQNFPIQTNENLYRTDLNVSIHTMYASGFQAWPGQTLDGRTFPLPNCGCATTAPVPLSTPTLISTMQQTEFGTVQPNILRPQVPGYVGSTSLQGQKRTYEAHHGN